MQSFLDKKLIFAFLLPLASLACDGGDSGAAGSAGKAGSAGTGGTGATGATAGSGGTGGSASGSSGSSGSSGAAAVCEGKGYGGMEKVAMVGVVKATLVDQDAKPASGVPVFVCGTDVCTPPAKSGANGSTTINANTNLKAPAFKYGDGLEFAKFAAPVPAGDTTFDMNIVSLRLPAVGTGDLLTPGASAKSNGVVIDIAAGAKVKIDLLTYEDPAQATFRAALLPAGANVPAVDPTLDLEVVYGAAPMETLLCPAAKLHIPNTAGWAANAPVEFFIHGLEVGQEWAPYGGWAMVSEGAVSADGKEVVTADGQGIPFLSTFGVRLKK